MHIRSLRQALGILSKAQRAVHITIVLFECAEQFNIVEIFDERVLALRPALFLEHLLKLTLLDQGVKAIFMVNVVDNYLCEWNILHNTVAIAIRQAKQHMDLERC